MYDFFQDPRYCIIKYPRNENVGHDVSKTKDELKLDPRRLEKLIQACGQAYATLQVLEDTVQEAYAKHYQLMVNEIDKLSRASVSGSTPA